MRVLKEAEALSLWCPWSLVPHTDGSVNSGHMIGANRNKHGAPLPGSYCMGSSCMAWEPSPINESEGYCLRMGGTVTGGTMETAPQKKVSAAKGA